MGKHVGDVETQEQANEKGLFRALAERPQNGKHGVVAGVHPLFAPLLRAFGGRDEA